MSRQALELALEALTYIYTETTADEDELIDKAITAIKEALAQPEQEPVAWMNDSTPSGIFARHIDGARNFGCTIPLYTTPPQRTWVGLTEEEIKYLLSISDNEEDFAYAIERKLKEKNT